MLQLVIYAREGCPHCERLIRMIESCPHIHARGVRVTIVPSLTGPLSRGQLLQPPMRERFGDTYGTVAPQLLIRAKKGGYELELVVAGAPHDEEEFCRVLSQLAEFFA